MFPVKYEINSYILFRRNSVSKGLSYITFGNLYIFFVPMFVYIECKFFNLLNIEVRSNN
jgi:hypothetical protein